MAYIVHNSTGATNHGRQLEVAGSVLELPGDMIHNFQGDSGINMSGGSVATWVSNIDNEYKTLTAQQGDPNYKPVYVGGTLNDIPSLRFGRLYSTYPYNYSQMSGDTYNSFNNSPLRYSVAVVLTVLDTTNSTRILRTCSAAYQAVAGISIQSGHLYIAGVDMGVMSAGDPYVIVYVVDYVAHTIRYCINSLEVAVAAFTDTPPPSYSTSRGFLGAPLGYFYTGGIFDIHAYISWFPTTLLTDANLITISEYLKTKYGISFYG